MFVSAIYCLSSLISAVILDRSSDRFPEVPYCAHRCKNKIIYFFLLWPLRAPLCSVI